LVRVGELYFLPCTALESPLSISSNIAARTKHHYLKKTYTALLSVIVLRTLL
jgi:hypothetical protein